MEDIARFAQALGVYAPHVMLVAGVALMIVPRWLRWSIAVTLIAFGLAGIWPELLDAPPTVETSG